MVVVRGDVWRRAVSQAADPLQILDHEQDFVPDFGNNIFTVAGCFRSVCFNFRNESTRGGAVIVNMRIRMEARLCRVHK